MKAPFKVMVVINIPTPYRNVFFGALSKRCALRVVFDSPIESNRSWTVNVDRLGFETTFAAGWTISYKRRRPDLSFVDTRYLHLRAIIVTLASERPDLVVSTEFGTRSIQAVLYTKLFRKKLVILSEGTRHSEGWVGGIKRAVRKVLCRYTDYFWTSGDEAKQLLIDYGADPQKIATGFLGIETDLFLTEVGRALPERSELRQELGYRGFTLLFVGQFVERKGVRQLLDALTHLYRKYPSGWTVSFVGNGHLEDAIARWTETHPGIDVRLPGFAGRSEVVRHYVAADLFVLPTLDDNWSVVTLEAAIAGLPQVYSKYNGASSDIAAAGGAGFVCDPLDSDSFGDALVDAFEQKLPRLNAETRLAIASYYSPHEMARRAVNTFHEVDHRVPREPGSVEPEIGVRA